MGPHKGQASHSLLCSLSLSLSSLHEKKGLDSRVFRSEFSLANVQNYRALKSNQFPPLKLIQSSHIFHHQSFPEKTHMARTRPGKKESKDADSYTIRGTNKIVRAGDTVLMRPSDTGKPPYVARIEKIEGESRGGMKVRVRWYYRPEESIGGRRQFHGAKELFLSDHYDVQSAHTIEGKCTVHSFKNYTKLENVGAEDYYCRFEYKAATGAFSPDRVAVYCKCEMPYNPDDLMVQCEGCKDWYHPACVAMTIVEAKKLESFLCSECSAEGDGKKPQNAVPAAVAKLEPKRRKK